MTPSSRTALLSAACLAWWAALVPPAAGEPPRPSPRQLAWQRHELIAFAHFGMNTFTNREWGDGKESPQLFRPSDFDARQWAAVLAEAGCKLLILTAKHHDGFCLWPSELTGHSVKNSPWRGGKGDVVREVTEALREKGIRAGLYLSPWDRNHPSYGDSPRYNAYFLGQLRELLENYGPVDEVWFDGACGEGPNGRRQEYDWPAYYALIRELQPDALIAISGPDIRWVGNESGVAREDESSVVSRDGKPAWYPAECDVSIRPGWFYHPQEDSAVKSLATLADIYFKSVGRNSVLLLNIPPDPRGRIADADAARLREFRRYLDELYAVDFARGAAASGPAKDGAAPPQVLLDGRLDTAWSPPAGAGEAWVEFDLGEPRTFNVARIQEDIRLGERVSEYRVEAWAGDKWRVLSAGRVIGHKQLRRFPAVTAQRVRLTIAKSSAPPALAEFGLHFNRLAPAGSGALTAHCTAAASDVHPGGTQYGADKAVDDDPGTRWATSDGTRRAWLEVELAKPEKIGRVAIRELDPRIAKFELQYRPAAGGEWRTAFTGGRAGTNFAAEFPPVEASRVRLNILDAANSPTIWEFQVFAPPKR